MDNLRVAKKAVMTKKIVAIQLVSIELVIGMDPIWAIFSAAREISIYSLLIFSNFFRVSVTIFLIIK